LFYAITGTALRLAAALVLMIQAVAHAQGLPYQDKTRPLEERVDDLMRRLTPDEKIALKGGASGFTTQAIPRLGIPALRVTDGPNGVRSTNGDSATAFPVGIAMAATWNPDLIRGEGQAIGEEARALGDQVLLGPNVNIQRNPLAGRNFESYSEDPVLAGQIGIGFVDGVQSRGVGVAVKHFVANNQEFARMWGSSDVDERTLREIYLPAFESIVTEAKPWMVMTAYNKINGVFASEDRWLIEDVLKKGWGFDGAVISDWGGTHATAAAANAGLDLEMPGPPGFFGDKLAQAVKDGQVDKAIIDDSARRMLRLILRTGVLDGGPKPAGEINTPAHARIAEQVADEAITLLKNDGAILPLDESTVRRIAVIGPNANKARIQGGGSAQVTPFRHETPLEALRATLGSRVRIDYVQGVDNEPMAPEADPRLLSPTKARDAQGLAVAYFSNTDFSGPAVQTAVDTHFFKLSFGEDLSSDSQAPFSARWQGWFWPPVDGVYTFGLMQMGTGSLFIDGKAVVDGKTASKPAPILSYLPDGLREAQVILSAGVPVPIRLDYVSGPHPPGILRLSFRVPNGTIEDAVKAAQGADAAIVFVGSSSIADNEGVDQPDMDLPGAQNALVAAVRAANPKTIVVLNNGAPLAMPWIDDVPAVLEAWLPGQEGARAVADILFGRVDPSGKLPITFPRRLEDNPAYLYYPGGDDEQYGEGLFVGYRYYDKKKLAPLFPFGYGLSYTKFDYADLTAPDHAESSHPIEIGATIRNAGPRAGLETVQLYVGPQHPHETRPLKELKRFAKIHLDPGEAKTVRFTLTARDLSYYDPHRQGWICEPGAYDILVGASSADIRLTRTIQIDR
jgi:beta-glucosidase